MSTSQKDPLRLEPAPSLGDVVLGIQYRRVEPPKTDGRAPLAPLELVVLLQRIDQQIGMLRAELYERSLEGRWTFFLAWCRSLWRNTWH